MDLWSAFAKEVQGKRREREKRGPYRRSCHRKGPSHLNQPPGRGRGLKAWGFEKMRCPKPPPQLALQKGNFERPKIAFSANRGQVGGVVLGTKSIEQNQSPETTPQPALGQVGGVVSTDLPSHPQALALQPSMHRDPEQRATLSRNRFHGQRHRSICGLMFGVCELLT